MNLRFRHPIPFLASLPLRSCAYVGSCVHTSVERERERDFVCICIAMSLWTIDSMVHIFCASYMQSHFLLLGRGCSLFRASSLFRDAHATCVLSLISVVMSVLSPLRLAWFCIEPRLGLLSRGHTCYRTYIFFVLSALSPFKCMLRSMLPFCVQTIFLLVLSSSSSVTLCFSSLSSIPCFTSRGFFVFAFLWSCLIVYFLVCPYGVISLSLCAWASSLSFLVLYSLADSGRSRCTCIPFVSHWDISRVFICPFHHVILLLQPQVFLRTS